MASEVQQAAAKPRHVPWVRLGVAFTCLAVIAALLFVPSFAPWVLQFEHWTADWRTAYLSDSAPTSNPSIAVVLINDDTLKDLPSSPIDRGLLASLVTLITEAGARAIGLDVLFLKKTDDAKDKALIDVLKAGPVVLGAIDERGKPDLKPFQWDFQTRFLQEVGRPAGYLNLRHEQDGVVRYAAGPAPGSRYPKSFARSLAEADGKEAVDAGEPIPWLLDPSDGTTTFITIPAQDILAKSDSAIAALRDRIVIVGGDFQNRDRHRVPLSVRDGGDMTGVMIHAHLLAGMLDKGTAISELGPQAARWLLIGVASVGFCLGWLLWQSNVVSFVRWTLATLLLLAIDALCFRSFHLLMPFTLALTTWFASVTAGRAFHVIASSAVWSKTVSS